MKQPLELPEAFADRMKQQLGLQQYADFCEALQQRPVISLRHNPAKPFAAFDKSEPVLWANKGLYLSERPAFVFDPLIHAGAYYVQEASSMFTGHILQQKLPADKPAFVLDLCAAPGGKSTHLLATLPKGSLLISNEVDRPRLAALQENIMKWGHENVVVTSAAAHHFTPFEGFFDAIVVDAPCSGEGMFRKDHEAATRWSPSLVEQCSHIQKDILEHITKCLKPDGLLIYSTCTFAPQENEEQVKWLIDEKGFQAQKVNYPEDSHITSDTVATSEQTAEVYKFMFHKTRGEGFFAACLTRPEGGSFRHKFKKKKGRIFGKKIKEVKELTQYLKPEVVNDVVFYDFEGSIRMFRASHLSFIQAFYDKLYYVWPGTEAGSQTAKGIIPAHGSAMSRLLSDQTPSVELTYEEAISYLKKEPFNKEFGKKGWYIVRYKGAALGWVKALGNRFNNHYPAPYKIRKSR